MKLFSTYRKQNQALLLGTMVLLTFISIVSIRPTIGAYQANKQHKRAIEQAKNAPEEIQRLKTMVASFSEHNVSASSKEKLFETVSSFCQNNRLVIKSLGEPSVEAKDDYAITTHEIIVQGKYTDIVRLIYELEQVKKLGNVASVDFKTKIDRKHKKTYLLGSIYLQSINSLKTNNS